VGAVGGNLTLGTSTVVFGVAFDDVTAISFLYGDKPFKVPVYNGFFVFQGLPSYGSSKISNVAVAFKDGATQLAR
jgi:hypothetical protein